jgi:hypothetical protein
MEPRIAAAWQVLAPYSLPEQKLPASSTERDSLRSALLLFAASSDYQILGICAETIDLATTTLESYRLALGYPPISMPTTDIVGPIYLKFNSQTARCYLDRYHGDHRGVLVACQSFAAEGLNEMVGHLPLDLFAS